MTHASVDKCSFGDLYIGNFGSKLSQGGSFIMHSFTFSDYTIKYRPLCFLRYIYIEQPKSYFAMIF